LVDGRSFVETTAFMAAKWRRCKAAKKEREVVWYTTTKLETSRVLADVFRKKYPYINVVFIAPRSDR
jgi:hypothetical protein